MEDFKRLLIQTITDMIRINHYLEEFLKKRRDAYGISLISKQVRYNNDNMLDLVNTYLELVEISQKEEAL